MKRLTVFALVSAALALSAASALAESPSGRHTRMASRPSIGGARQAASLVPKSVTGSGYSVQVNIVTRVVGTALFRSTVDITNNTTTDGVTATYPVLLHGRDRRLPGLHRRTGHPPPQPRQLPHR